ncbi:MAG TPA: DUF1549 and DUF1553 domain-containing protein [Gemmataceae bacterium]|nr:DUF1549 and DUF1553 domain-containing protein [Gemmataceae bacterium]
MAVLLARLPWFSLSCLEQLPKGSRQIASFEPLGVKEPNNQEDRGMLAASITRFVTVAATAGVLCALARPLLAAVPAPTNEPKVDFERHLVGIFGRMGCNSGSCHGSFQGRGGFRLSLFGYDPEKDYLALTRDNFGRRIDAVDPDHSLLLLKPTGQVEHGGGLRFAKDSWAYQLLRTWIVQGASWTKGSGDVAAITVTPPEYRFPMTGESVRLAVRARFADGTEEDITRFCDFRTNDDAIAEVDASGAVKALRPGDTSIVVSYRGNVLAVRVMVPVAVAAGFHYPELATVNYIDREVFAKLRNLNIIPSDLSGDAEFLRRVTIDTIGSLPAPEEVRAFLADPDPDKRLKKIDALLASPLHAALWATKFCDITGNNTDALEQPRDMQTKRSQMWHDWLRKRFAENRPYDEIVHDILCATSRDGLSVEDWIQQVNALDSAAKKGFVTTYAEKPTLDLFWRRQQNVPIEQWGEKTAAAFMGVRLECAQCHKHPFDRWTQADYRAYANIFGAVVVGSSPEAKQRIDAENSERKQKGTANKGQMPVVREVFVVAGRNRALPDPDTNRPLPPKALGGPVIQADKGKDPRAVLYDWLHAPDNPFFARSFVNRVWGHYFGIGLVDPVDNFSLANPPSNERLLDALAKDFVDHHYDIRHLEHTVLHSRVYQLTSATNPSNKLDRNNYSHAGLRPMMAEVVLDVLNTALGVTETFGPDAPPGARAIEVGSSRLQNGNLAFAFRIFGRPPRTSACDCERALDPALPQTLFRMTDSSLLAKLQKGRLQQLLASTKTDDEILEELFLATLTRFPTEAEKQQFATYRHGRMKNVAAPAVLVAESPPKGKGGPAPAKKPGNREQPEQAARRAAFADALWALINTREFILNH